MDGWGCAWKGKCIKKRIQHICHDSGGGGGDNRTITTAWWLVVWRTVGVQVVLIRDTISDQEEQRNHFLYYQLARQFMVD